MQACSIGHVRCRQRLEAELASKTATLEERQHAAALLAAQQAELQAYAAEVEQEQQERLALEQRIRAMESKVGQEQRGAVPGRAGRAPGCGWRGLTQRRHMSLWPAVERVSHKSTHFPQDSRGSWRLVCSG